MFHSYLQGLQANPSGENRRKRDTQYYQYKLVEGYRFSDEEEEEGQYSPVSKPRGSQRGNNRGKNRGKKISMQVSGRNTRTINKNKPRPKKRTVKPKIPAYMAQEPEYDLMSENEYDSADDPWFTRGFSQASDLESGDDSQSDQEKQEDRLIDIVLELEKQRDIKAREVERLRLEKREAEKRARNATRTAREVARKARVALQKTRESGYFS
eukprot:CAMPEP_0203774590 /NCGR_PEP_ID=MMETSP0099_2-20121227/5447_1 /ASSEMBLY_ACC=CAM_ASM_000209 /TAXON_ID=96639 /ORGANISM=" , Strain NY0313808BC1" /LENGTH=210 /DNA_ID=CAMNT_0050672847 /DNA_START=555 /DNA_END=1184 /DNA_ORIENTATION=-